MKRQHKLHEALDHKNRPAGERKPKLSLLGTDRDDALVGGNWGLSSNGTETTVKLKCM